MEITSHFTKEEFERSGSAIRNGIDNTIKEKGVLNNIKALCENVLEPVRVGIGVPIIISSGYRSKQLNRAINGATNSQHCKGEAADIYIKNEGRKGLQKILKYIIDNDIIFDQLIWEYNSWIHVSYKRTGVNRNQILTCYKSNKYTEVSKEYCKVVLLS